MPSMLESEGLVTISSFFFFFTEEEDEDQGGAHGHDLVYNTAQIFPGQKYPGPALVMWQINRDKYFVVKMTRSSENQRQMQVHKKHDWNAPGTPAVEHKVGETQVDAFPTSH